MAPKNKEIKLLFVECRSIVERVEEFENLLDSVNADASDANLKRLKIEVELFKPLLEEYKGAMNSIIASNADIGDLPTLIEFHKQYVTYLVNVDSLLEEHSKLKSVSRSNSIESISSARISTKDNIKLPTIALPVFEGIYKDFRSFYETFEALVGSNADLSQTEKFLYLKNSLKGPAGQMINELKATESNYSVAIQLLKSRYDNKKLLIFSHFDSLFESPKLAKDSNLREFYDDLIKHLRAVENENLTDSEYKDAVIAYIVKNKTDPRTSAGFAKNFPKRIPTVEEISQFLSDRCNVIDDASSLNKSLNAPKRNCSKGAYTLAQTSYSCVLCKEQHFLNRCPSFLALAAKARFHKARSLRMCLVCLRHTTKSKCTSTFNCKHCDQRHNTLLCLKNSSASDQREAQPQSDNTSALNIVPEASPSSAGTSTSFSICNLSRSSEVLLATVQVKISSGDNVCTVRGLLDPGSQHDLISENLHRKLNSPCKPINLILRGVNDAVSSCSKYTSVKLQSLTGRFKANIDCLVVPTITGQLPRFRFSRDLLDIPPHLRLADSSFHEPGDIDILIGSAMFYKLLLPQRISLGASLPILQGTLLGWIVAGDLPTNCISSLNISDLGTSAVSCHAMAQGNDPDLDLRQSLTKFWELDNPLPIAKRSLLSAEEKFCEDHFANTIHLDDTGHLMVSIPFKAELSLLGDSKQMAESRFFKLEKRLQRAPGLLREYSQFMAEYEAMGHMTKITGLESYVPADSVFVETLNGPIDIADIPPQFFPHHAVIKQSSLTTKVRVVFDASAKSSTNVSVNETQINGPQVQDNLFDLLLRFRTHPVALCGDIAKMYRMINVDPTCRKFQHILWRDNPYKPLEIYRLNTVTYGTTSASYLATRCLQYLAETHEDSFPEASEILSKQFYMDDLLFSTDSVEKAIKVKKDISSILSSAGFTIRKFLSNRPEVLDATSSEDIELATLPIEERSDSRTLGIHWDSLNDSLFCKIELPDDESVPTKRKILAIVAKIFDPLGFFSPLVIQGKLLIQRLWELGLGWDDPIPEDLIPQWSNFKGQLLNLNRIRFPRCIAAASHQTSSLNPSPESFARVELHGFCDSSSVAFGCCFYVRHVLHDGSIRCNLLFSKSKVAPLRTITIPRLELCAAVLMAQWCFKILNTLNIIFLNIFLWTDSKIVLSWINSAPNKYKTFIANRIAVIQECTNTQDWHHVATANNPADLISRGANISILNSNHLWLRGPEFLFNDESQWCINQSNIINLNEPTEMKRITSINATVVQAKNSIFEKYSSAEKLQRVFSYAHRFIRNCRNSDKLTGPLKVGELEDALLALTKLCQHESFSREIKAIENNRNVKSSNIQSLNPFLDPQGCLRVGGRLVNSDFDYNKKHPLLLPKGHKFTELIVRKYHKELLHGGAQQLLYNIRERFWPIGGLSFIKKLLRGCVSCFRTRPIVRHPMMGNLPKTRLNAVYPFHNVGLDYAGPIMMKDRSTRGAKLTKCYICVFVCMVTRAMHLELVTSLSTDAFINTLKRFIARRGIPRCVSSDNATNFRGAKTKLDNLYSLLHDKNSHDQIYSYLANRSIRWEFINPRSPHEGGLWEGGVKSVKTHLKRVLANAHLTFEQLYTTLTMIESVLNSRPLSRMSCEPDDLVPLSPGHFLIGRPLNALPEPDITHVRENRLKLYQRAQKMVQHFWRRWSKEVVSELQRRQKWTKNLPDLLHLDSIVLLQDEGLPPLQWPLGRVVELHHGYDNVLRAASVKLASGSVVRRSVHRLCVLPN